MITELPPARPSALQPFLDELLAEQGRLDTPVARFSAAAADRRGSAVLEKQLIPLSAPGPGEQYAFEVDLDACTGCKSCVAACHSLNGLDDEETWRDVGLLVSSDRRHPFTQTVTTACHHCEDPACLNGCPVLAYEKDPITGIVRHLDDQCIGCSYCVLKCPYDVPKYSRRLGIVRKCDLCHGRLAHGEAPACAQACPTQAIRVVTVRTDAEMRSADSEMRSAESGMRNGKTRESSGAGRAVPGEPRPATPSTERLGGTGHPCSPSATFRTPHSALRNSSDLPHSAIRTPHSRGFLPGAPDPAYTRPTTRYVSRRGLPAEVMAADAAALRPQPAHWPLVFLLTLMPLAIGCGWTDKLLQPATPALAVTNWLAAAAGLTFSVAHLGQPTRAWRIFLGLRRSWLSREAVVFGGWFPLASVYTAIRLGWIHLPTAAAHLLGAATATLGAVGLLCSVMIYADTRRAFWRFAHTAPRFFGTAAVLGFGGALAGLPTSDRHWPYVAAVLAAAVVLKLLFESHALAPLNGDRDTVTPALTTARLLAGPLRGVNELRLICGVTGGLFLPAIVAAWRQTGALCWLALGLLVAGELLERSLFFRAVDAPKMPGVPR